VNRVEKIRQSGRTIIISGGKRSIGVGRTARGPWVYLVMFMLIIFLMGVDAYMRSITTGTLYAVSSEFSQIEKIKARREELKVTIASLKNPRRIERIALKRLGLKDPGVNEILRER
jgi:cell division protein FtsL